MYSYRINDLPRTGILNPVISFAFLAVWYFCYSPWLGCVMMFRQPCFKTPTRSWSLGIYIHSQSWLRKKNTGPLHLGLKKAAKTWIPPFSSLSRVRRPTDFEGKTGKLIHQVSIWCLYLGHRSGYSSHFRPPATHQKGIADVERRIMLEASRPADVSLPRNGATPNLRQFSQGNDFGTGFRGLPHLQTTPYS